VGGKKGRCHRRGRDELVERYLWSSIQCPLRLQMQRDPNFSSNDPLLTSCMLSPAHIPTRTAMYKTRPAPVEGEPWWWAHDITNTTYHA
jgi:hypothetical protein